MAVPTGDSSCLALAVQRSANTAGPPAVSFISFLLVFLTLSQNLDEPG